MSAAYLPQRASNVKSSTRCSSATNVGRTPVGCQEDMLVVLDIIIIFFFFFTLPAQASQWALRVGFSSST
jgi:hypothetical protein